MKVGRHTYGHEAISVRHWGEPAELTIGSFCSIADRVSVFLGGNPARVIRSRFDSAVVEGLLRIRWWEWSDEEIDRNTPLLCSRDLERFIGAHEKATDGD